MPFILPDQNWTIPTGPDLANNPLAFSSFAAGLLGNVILRYPNTATRDSFNGSRVAGDISFTAGRTWYDRWTGSKWLPCTPVQAVKTANQIVNNSTTFTNDLHLVVPIPALSSTYAIDALIAYFSSTVADIKFQFTVPAGSGFNFGGNGLATGAAGVTGDGSWGWATSAPFGGGGFDTFVRLNGTLASGGTAGNLQLQWAQNTLEVSNTTVYARSWLCLTAIS